MWLDGAGSDLSGTGNTGTLNSSPTKVRVLQNDWLTYNGSSQSVSTGINTTWAMTVSAWIYFSTLPTNGWIVTKDSGTAVNGCQFNIWINGSQQLRWAINTSWWTERHIVYTTALATNKWHNIVWTFSGSGWELRLFLNWVDIWNLAWAATTQATTGTTMYVGRRGNWWYFPWNIVNPMIYNRALSATEVQLLHKATFIK